MIGSVWLHKGTNLIVLVIDRCAESSMSPQYQTWRWFSLVGHPDFPTEFIWYQLVFDNDCERLL